MKELSIEEKAKAYDEARKKIAIRFGSNVANEIFSQFEMSEDERIRKEIRDFICWATDRGSITREQLEKSNSWLAWLEKQGKQKPTDKVEPKFKVGDFLVNDYCMGKVVELTNDAYLLDTGQGIPFSCEHNAHIWTIQDANAGDVLYSPCCKLLWIYKDEKTCHVGSNLNYNYGSIVVNRPICIPTDVHPAPKEQRELLFQKMRDAGYEWDADKLELKKLNEKTDAWSEEDEEMIQDIINDIEIAQEQVYCKSRCEDEINWLKVLKDKYTLKPSDKQLNALDMKEVDLKKLGEIARHLIAVKEHIEDMRLDKEEWLMLEKIGYPERFKAQKEG